MPRFPKEPKQGQDYNGTVTEGPPYNRICPDCNVRWTFGERPKDMDGVELFIARCAACNKGWRQPDDED